MQSDHSSLGAFCLRFLHAESELPAHLRWTHRLILGFTGRTLTGKIQISLFIYPGFGQPKSLSVFIRTEKTDQTARMRTTVIIGALVGYYCNHLHCLAFSQASQIF